MAVRSVPSLSFSLFPFSSIFAVYSFCIIEILRGGDEEKNTSRPVTRGRKTRETEAEQPFETDSATNGLLVKRWSEVQPSLHLSPWVCGPPQMSAGGSSPPSKHKAVKRFNSIRTDAREGAKENGGGDFNEFNASDSFRASEFNVVDLPYLSILTRSAFPSLPPGFLPLFVRYLSFYPFCIPLGSDTFASGDPR